VVTHTGYHADATVPRITAGMITLEEVGAKR